MGCGISKIDPEEAGGRPKRSQKRNANNNTHANYDTINVEDADDFVNDHQMHGACKSVSNGVVQETDNLRRDNYNEKGHRKEFSFYDGKDVIAYPTSPSFREYCVHSDSDGNDENGSERASNVEKVHIAERTLDSEKAHESKSTERHTKSTRKGLRSAIHKPAEWIGKSKK